MAELHDPLTLECCASTEDMAKASGIRKSKVKPALAALLTCVITEIEPGRPLHPARYRMNGFPAGLGTKSEPSGNRVTQHEPEAGNADEWENDLDDPSRPVWPWFGNRCDANEFNILGSGGGGYNNPWWQVREHFPANVASAFIRMAIPPTSSQVIRVERDGSFKLLYDPLPEAFDRYSIEGYIGPDLARSLGYLRLHRL